VANHSVLGRKKYVVSESKPFGIREQTMLYQGALIFSSTILEYKGTNKPSGTWELSFLFQGEIVLSILQIIL
jgi:hypothetical protein